MRVRTTSFNDAPALISADSMFLRICTVCWYGSPTPTIFPIASVAVVPETWTILPTRTAREYPTIGSHLVPVEMRCRVVIRNEHAQYGLKRGAIPNQESARNRLGVADCGLVVAASANLTVNPSPVQSWSGSVAFSHRLL